MKRWEGSGMRPPYLVEIDVERTHEVPKFAGWELVAQGIGSQARLRLRWTAEGGCPHMFDLPSAVFFVLFEDEGIGHACDVITDHPWQAFLLSFVLILVREGFWIGHPEGKQF